MVSVTAKHYEKKKEGEERVKRTRRGFMRRVRSFSHCLHLVVIALAKMGTPQLGWLLVCEGGEIRRGKQ